MLYRNSELVLALGTEAFDKILVFTAVVIGVCRMMFTVRPEHQVVIVHDTVEMVIVANLSQIYVF